MSLFKKRSLIDDVDLVERERVTARLLEDSKVKYPTGLRLKVRDKKVLTQRGRDALRGDELVVEDAG